MENGHSLKTTIPWKRQLTEIDYSPNAQFTESKIYRKRQLTENNNSPKRTIILGYQQLL